MSNDIRIIQLKELDIVRAFVQVCNDNDLTYYMVGGTLLGAARHKGFIPWDDDMDFAMPRADYERFLEDFINSCLSISKLITSGSILQSTFTL